MVDGDNFEVWEEKGLNFTFKKIIKFILLVFYVYVFTPKSEILFLKKKSK